MSKSKFTDNANKEAPLCSRCGSSELRKHGQHLGKQRYFCKKCGYSYTGGEYRYHPAHDTNALHIENQRLLQCVEAGRRMVAALDTYFDLESGRSLRNLHDKRDRFARLLAGVQIDGRVVHDAAPQELQEEQNDTRVPHGAQPKQKPAFGVSSTKQGSLFEIRVPPAGSRTK